MMAQLLVVGFSESVCGSLGDRSSLPAPLPHAPFSARGPSCAYLGHTVRIFGTCRALKASVMVPIILTVRLLSTGNRIVFITVVSHGIYPYYSHVKRVTSSNYHVKSPPCQESAVSRVRRVKSPPCQESLIQHMPSPILAKTDFMVYNSEHYLQIE